MQVRSLWKGNVKSKVGRSDILTWMRERTGIVVEAKYTDDSNPEKGCAGALEEIEKKNTMRCLG